MRSLFTAERLQLTPIILMLLSHLDSQLRSLPPEQGGGVEAAQKAISDHSQKYPWVKKAWQILAANAEEDSEKLAIWKRAEEANPDQGWPWNSATGSLIQAKDWESVSCTF